MKYSDKLERHPADGEVERTADELAAQLRARGVSVRDTDSPLDIIVVLEAVEAFEQAVERAGGDLMVDEPPPGKTAEPDDERFVLPMRRMGERAPDFAARISQAAEAVAGERGS